MTTNIFCHTIPAVRAAHLKVSRYPSANVQRLLHDLNILYLFFENKIHCTEWKKKLFGLLPKHLTMLWLSHRQNLIMDHVDQEKCQ